jgi:hypothetical protein
MVMKTEIPREFVVLAESMRAEPRALAAVVLRWFAEPHAKKALTGAMRCITPALDGKPESQEQAECDGDDGGRAA